MFNAAQLDRIENKLNSLLRWAGRFDAYLSRVTQMENITMATLDDVVAEVTAQTSIVASVKALVAGLQTQLADAIASNDPAKVQAVLDALKANDAALAEAVPANTPAEAAPADAPAAEPTP